MRNENLKKKKKIFFKGLVVIFLFSLLVFKLIHQQSNILSAYKSGLQMGHLIAFVESTCPSEDKVNELSIKYEKLKSASNISESEEKIQEIISLIQIITDEIEEDNNRLEEKSEQLNELLLKSNN